MVNGRNAHNVQLQMPVAKSVHFYSESEQKHRFYRILPNRKCFDYCSLFQIVNKIYTRKYLRQPNVSHRRLVQVLFFSNFQSWQYTVHTTR